MCKISIRDWLPVGVLLRRISILTVQFRNKSLNWCLPSNAVVCRKRNNSFITLLCFYDRWTRSSKRLRHERWYNDNNNNRIVLWRLLFVGTQPKSDKSWEYWQTVGHKVDRPVPAVVPCRVIMKDLFFLADFYPTKGYRNSYNFLTPPTRCRV